MNESVCTICGKGFSTRCVRKNTCSPACVLVWRRAYKKQWVNADPQRERERQREAEKRRKRRLDPVAKEARLKYMRDRYCKRSDLVFVLKEEMPELLKEFGL